MEVGAMACTLQELIRHMLATSGKSAAQVSRELGNDSNHLSVILSSGRVPRLDLFVKIADACGYAVELHELRDFEKWDLATEQGKVVAAQDYGPEDLPDISKMHEDARETLKGMGRRELIDSLIEYLESLKEQQ
jgi:predicted alpha/beta hydrolase